MAPGTYSQAGRVLYDWAITGYDDNGTESIQTFLDGSQTDFPYLREGDTSLKQQVSTTSEPGENQLSGFWFRSQGSFHYGMGINWGDTAGDDSVAKRFSDSCGVDVFTPGKVSLLRKAKTQNAYVPVDTNIKSYVFPYAYLSDSGSVTSEGVLYARSNFTSGTIGSFNAYSGVLTYINVTNGTYANIITGSTDMIYDVTTDGGSYYVLHDNAICKGPLCFGDPAYTNGSVIYTLDGSGQDNVKRGRIALLKDRLVVAITAEQSDGSQYGRIYYVSPNGSGGALPVRDGTGELAKGYININGWRFTGICDGPNAVYFSGYTGDTSRVYAQTIDKSVTDSTAAPNDGAPYVVAELPKGEYCSSMVSYMGTYLVLGTNKGVRVCVINPDGSLTVGPLSVETETPVWGMCVLGDSVYFGGGKHYEREAVNSTFASRIGTYRLFLGVDGSDPRNQLGIYPVERYVFADNTSYSGSNQILRVSPVGITNRIAFSVDNVGLFIEDASELVANGWIRTGKMRYDTATQKNFLSVTTTNEASAYTSTTIRSFITTEAYFENAVASWDSYSVFKKEGDVTTNGPNDWAQLTFVLSRNGSITSSGPVLTGYQMKAVPANVTNRTIRAVFLCDIREKTRDGQWVRRSTWDRIRKVENAERIGRPVRLQNLRTGENILGLIEKTQFVSTNVGSVGDVANPCGMLMVSVRKI